jgi:hypothetical protein
VIRAEGHGSLVIVDLEVAEFDHPLKETLSSRDKDHRS